MAAGVKAQLSSIADPSAVATPFLMVDHIGGGSQVPAFGEVVDEIKGSLSGWAGFEQAAPGSAARIIVQSVSDVIRRSDELTVSPELDVCLVSHAGGGVPGIEHRARTSRSQRRRASFAASLSARIGASRSR